MNKPILSISVVIPTLNRDKTLKETLASFLSGESVPKQIVIVDQSNDNKTKELVLSESRSEVHFTYIHLEKPSSTMARNIGLAACSQEYIIFSDDDINIYSDTLQKVYTRISSPTVAMVAAYDDCTKQHKSCLSYIAGINSIRKRKIGSVSKSCFGSYPTVINGSTSTEWAMGFFFVVKKSLLNKWNLKWDEHLVSYAYNEDLDFSYRYYKHATEEKMSCMLFDDIHVRHLQSKEYRIPSKKHIRMFVLHRYYIVHKQHMGLSALILTTYANFFFVLRSYIQRDKTAKNILQSMKVYFHNKHAIDKGDIEEFLQ